MVEKAAPSPHVEHLASAAVRDAVDEVLRWRNVPAADREDLRQIVLEKALVTAMPPPTLEQCIALARKIARDVAVDSYRRRRTRSKYETGPYEEERDEALTAAPGNERDPIDAQRQLDSIRRDITEGRLSARQADILASAVDGVPGPEIAAELGLHHQTVRNELSAARKTVRRSWAAFVALAVIAAIAIFSRRLRNEDQVASPNRENAPSIPGPAVLEVAAELRQSAIDDANASRWRECVEDLARAGHLDPAGDSDPKVRALREDCERHVRGDQAPQDTHSKLPQP